MSQSAHKCPVCLGAQRVPRSLYEQPALNTEFVPCRTCNGSGVIWRFELDPQPIPYTPCIPWIAPPPVPEYGPFFTTCQDAPLTVNFFGDDPPGVGALCALSVD